MKLIIENIAGELYIYRESEKQFRKTEKNRTTPLRDWKEFDNDCYVHMGESFHYVVPIKGRTK